MNYPRPSDDFRNWRSIDIFLFTNGQEYSPPRKYHLTTEELKMWDATLHYLARSQFGPLHSNIELYTLDGVKILTPLELTNDIAYVAVNPPDAFIQSGYEKYLLKASRSREKRNEKLNGNIGINNDQVKTVSSAMKNNNRGEIDNNLLLDTEFLPTSENLRTFTESQKDAKSLKQIEATNNSSSIDKRKLMQRRKPEMNSKKNTMFKRKYANSKIKDDENNLNKNKTAPKTIIKSGNDSKRLTSSNNTNILKTKIENQYKTKDEPQTNNNIKTDEKITDVDDKTKQSINFLDTKKLPNNSEKDLTILSDVYNNTESDIQSVTLDIDRKAAALSKCQKILPPASGTLDELSETTKNCLKTNKTLFQHSASNLSDSHGSYKENQAGTFNINLNIDLNGYTVMKTEEKKLANKYKTFITFAKPEKATQINFDAVKDNLNFVDESLPQEQPVESGTTKIYEEKVDFNKTNVIVHCKCNILKSDNTSSAHFFKDNDHYLIVIPSERIDKLLSRGDLENIRWSDKDIQELFNSGIPVPLSSNSEKHKVITKLNNKIISQDACEEHKFNNTVKFKSQGDIVQPTLINDLKMPNHKIDNFTQTDWSNILLQAKCHEDRRYTFHLPPLHLLMHYNLL